MRATNANELEFLKSNSKEYMLENFKLPISTEKIVVFDVGSNIGMFAMSTKEEFPNSEIHCFEPMPDLFKVLSLNLKDLAILNQLAIMETGDQIISGTYLPNYTLLSGFFVDQEDKRKLEDLAGKDLNFEFEEQKIEAKTMRLDTYITSNKLQRVHILKIDVEKAELGVLKSLGECSKAVDNIVCEVHEETKEDVLQWLSNNNFELKYISEPSLPRYCLQKVKLETWDASLNTYILQASRAC